MAGPLFGLPKRPPPLYRLARALRWASALVLVLLILFVATVAYSASSLARSSSNLSQVTTSFGTNDTAIVAAVLSLDNPGFYPANGLTLTVRLANQSAAFLGSSVLGPVDLAGQGTTSYPIALYIPVGATGPGASLLTQDQTLRVAIWANATYAYLFPAAIALQENRSWGAPFAHLMVSVGAVTLVNGTPTVAVTLSFQNEASSITVAGTLDFAVVSAAGVTCGSGSFPMKVPPMQQYSQTEPVSLAPGCNPSGGDVTSRYVAPGYTIPLPPQEIP